MCPKMEIMSPNAKSWASWPMLSPACALDALRLEIRYHLELCPCSSIEEKWIELVVK